MTYIKLYKAEDNSEISGEGVFVNSVDFSLRADLNEDGEKRLYAQAEVGYVVKSTTVQPEGTSAARWQLAPDSEGSAGEYLAGGAELTLGQVSEGAGGREYFWVKASAVDTESPSNDTSVLLKCEGIAEEA